MLVTNLDNLFNIVAYAVDRDGRATVELVDGTVKLRIPYHFKSSLGVESPVVMVRAEATQQQLDDLKAVLAAVLQATNAAIEAEHGWEKYVHGEPGV